MILSSVFAAAASVAARLPVLAVLAGAAFVLIYLGVVLPAVWSAKPARRAAAAAVLQQLLGVLRRPR